MKTRRNVLWSAVAAAVFFPTAFLPARAAEFPKPYSPPAVERENVFAFTQKPTAKYIGSDKYKITFAVKGRCDVTVGIVDPAGKVVRHLASGVLGSNAPAPLQKNSLSQTLIWNGKDDLSKYPKEPARLRVRVMLGLKPVFDKRLGGKSPYNLPCGAWGIAAASDGVYVIAANGGGFNHGTVRKFGHAGEYLGTIMPPPSGTSLSKLSGMGFIEYEKGKRALHGNNLHDSIAGNGGVMRGMDGNNASYGQIALAGKRLVYFDNIPRAALFYLNTDGSTDVKGLSGTAFGGGGNWRLPWLATASPSGRLVYLTGGKGLAPHAIFRWSPTGSKPPAAFLGKPGKPGSDNAHLNAPAGLDCDAQGRVYVADSRNNRLQIFSPDGKYLKTIRVSRPGLVRVHQKTGAIYVQHAVRIHGKSVARLTKFISFDRPKEEFHAAGVGSALMTVDSWTAKPRLWLGNSIGYHHGRPVVSYDLKVYEEVGGKLRLLKDFDAEARKEAGANYMGRWAGDCFDKVVCDPTRERVYYRNSVIFDLKTGKLLGRFTPARRCRFDDAAFDKHGFMHLHFNPCFFGQGVGRVDPAQAIKDKGKNVFRYPEIPYDYGITKLGWTGILPTKDQCGAKGFQDGLGVNMKGDVASESNIYYVPKWAQEVRTASLAGNAARLKSGVWSEEQNSYNRWLNSVKEAQKRGEAVYAIKLKPGVPVHGGTIWTYNSLGELTRECAVTAGDLINGCQIDEDRAIYFVNSRPKIYREKPFLYGKAGLLGKKGRAHLFTGTLIKTKPNRDCYVLMARAKVKLNPLPKRPPDLMSLDFMSDEYIGKGAWCWVDGAAWLYAGAGPITSVGCSCPRQHLGLDWYKRTYLPEGYRHSIGILDANGNLIMHLGRYGNFDEAPGGKNGAKPGGTDIRLQSVRFISATDNYLVFGDWGERLVVLKLAYHAEETVPIRMK